MHKITSTACVLAASLAAATAHADSVPVTFDGISGNYGSGISVTLSGGYTFADGASSKGIWAGQLSHTIDGIATLTYCIELTQWADSGTYDRVAVAEGSGMMGQEKAEAIYRLFNATNGTQDIDTNTEATAFQAAIWEIVYDFDSGINIAGGNVQFGGVSNNLFNLYTGYATDLQGDITPNVIAYTNDQFQDQLSMQVVPLPGVAAMAGLGLGGMAIRRRRQA
ncbi:hypothetical protein MNBD_PLANCTO03-873 [hydrothermal vent metagenome]|uniref:PEP-CTERM protein-sorting domain-containing protein n=1 Tax=hydrothermal vent metagenome TaxID=652676 RepID=A0A3B1DX27_9ZZZZ